VSPGAPGKKRENERRRGSREGMKDRL
jgi:hypothetical protein